MRIVLRRVQKHSEVQKRISTPYVKKQIEVVDFLGEMSRIKRRNSRCFETVTTNTNNIPFRH